MSGRKVTLKARRLRRGAGLDWVQSTASPCDRWHPIIEGKVETRIAWGKLVLAGSPHLTGTRLSVAGIAGRIESGHPWKDIQAEAGCEWDDLNAVWGFMGAAERAREERRRLRAVRSGRRYPVRWRDWGEA